MMMMEDAMVGAHAPAPYFLFFFPQSIKISV